MAGGVEALLHEVDGPGHLLDAFELREAGGRPEAEGSGEGLAGGGVGEEVERARAGAGVDDAVGQDTEWVLAGGLGGVGQLAVHVDAGLGDDSGPDVGPPRRPFQCRPAFPVAVVPSLRAFAELADAALDGRLDRGQHRRHPRVDLLVVLHGGEELPVVQVRGDAEVGERVGVGGLEAVVPRIQIRTRFPAQERLDGGDVVAEFLGVGEGVRLVPGRPFRPLPGRRERRGQTRVQLDPRQVDQPGAGHLLVEGRAVEMIGAGEADDQAGGGGEERGVQVQADRVRQQALLIRQQLHVPHPLERLLVEEPARPALRGRVFGRRLRRGGVHRLGAERARVVGGSPLAGGLVLHGAGRRPQRGHELQPGGGGGAARRDHPGRVRTQHAGDVRRLHLADAGPGPGIERVPRQDRELHALPLPGLRRPVDPRPRPEAALRQLPLRLRELLDDRVVVLQTQGTALLVALQTFRQAELHRGRPGEHDQRVGVLPLAVQLRGAEPGLLQRPLH